ncbi:hypothetical protein IF2G_04549 [Cordyceps javanica]|nr:hypothetical protein IF2G_04549 [Cordyceps javanica]
MYGVLRMHSVLAMHALSTSKKSPVLKPLIPPTYLPTYRDASSLAGPLTLWIVFPSMDCPPRPNVPAKLENMEE